MSLELWVLLAYVSGLIITWLAFSYKKGCARRAHRGHLWAYYSNDWDTVRLLCSVFWPGALFGFVIWFVGWVCILQWPARLIMSGTKKLEQLGQNKGCPKIVLDKR